MASGSCRDIAALFIEAIRYLRVGARAVSGYLCNAQQGADHPGSTHAWAEVYLPGAGWIAFDPPAGRRQSHPGCRCPQQPPDHADRWWLRRRARGLRRYGCCGKHYACTGMTPQVLTDGF
ncbi:transglutaminase family protein [Mesorhizobium sp. SB112]|uniref:transglutaminase-like domain-containing protein n=1 Tax=Mesorhizobium sp. SB112 TaxID=3151853 RepID=UPI003263E2C0